MITACACFPSQKRSAEINDTEGDELKEDGDDVGDDTDEAVEDEFLFSMHSPHILDNSLCTAIYLSLNTVS